MAEMTENATPLVSVVITVRNAEEYIEETIASILKEQDVPIEIVLIDNGCTDATIDLVKAFNDDRIRVLPGPKKGIAHALNVAYAAVRGEIVMRCDGDDLFPVERIKHQSKWLLDHPEFGVICGGFATIDAKGNPIADLCCEHPPEEITEELRSGNIRTHIGTFAVRTQVLRDAGGSREYFDCFEDFDFQLRLSETSRVWYAPEVFYIYRLHQKSSTHSTGSAKKEFYNSVAFEFQRQRLSRGYDDLQQGNPPVLPEGNYRTLPWDAAEHVQKLLLAGAWSEHRSGRKQTAVLKGLRAALTLPWHLKAWRDLFVLALKPAGSSSRA